MEKYFFVSRRLHECALTRHFFIRYYCLQEVMLLLSAFLLALSVAVLLYACYLERLLYLAAEVRARRDGYRAISDAHTEL